MSAFKKADARRLAMAHCTVPSAGTENDVHVRYDGEVSNGEEIVYRVINMAGLTRSTAAVAALKEMDADSVVFRETLAGPSAYLREEESNGVFKALREGAEAGEFRMFSYVGDLALMGGPDDILPPSTAAYEAAGFPEVDVSRIVEMFPEMESDGSSPSLS